MCHPDPTPGLTPTCGFLVWFSPGYPPPPYRAWCSRATVVAMWWRSPPAAVTSCGWWQTRSLPVDRWVASVHEPNV